MAWLKSGSPSFAAYTALVALLELRNHLPQDVSPAEITSALEALYLKLNEGFDELGLTLPGLISEVKGPEARAILSSLIADLIARFGK